MALLTNGRVEQKVLERVRLKASTFGQELEAPPTSPNGTVTVNWDDHGPPSPKRVDPDLIVQMYREQVIPLTKVAEVKYLLQRLSTPTVAFHGALGSACHSATVDRFVSTCPTGKTSPLLHACANVEEVFGAVMCNQAAYGVALLEQGERSVKLSAA